MVMDIFDVFGAFAFEYSLALLPSALRKRRNI
jgi:hypothetical protein